MKHLKAQPKTPPSKRGRGADRFDTRLPVEMGRIHGLTHNISATGIYFETDTQQEPGSRVHLSVEVNVLGERLKLLCDGEVVRVDHLNGMLGIAAKLTGSFFSHATEVIDFETGSLARTH